MNAYPINPGRRLLSIILDHVLMSILVALIIGPFMKLPPTGNLANTQPLSLQMFGKENVYLMLIGMTVYLCKDCFGGRSLAKRILNYQVLDGRTGDAASPLQCLLRNFSIVIWPVEIILVLFNPEKRLGDRIAGTIVVPYDSSHPTSPIKWLQIPICFLLGFAFLYLFMLPIH